MRLQDGNPMTMPIAVTLLFQVIVFGLAIPGMIMVDDVAVGLAFASGLGAAALALAAGATLRRPVGWPLAWLTQLAGIALGLLTPWMLAVGGAFALLFVIEFVLGRRLQALSPK
ncbi:MAG: DUF4233 domain-containing protein [Actinomycetes bacterium]